MRKLTSAAKRKYVERAYGKCPYCQSEDITGCSVEIDGNGAWQEVCCDSCGRRWGDLYRLVGIEEIIENGKVHDGKKNTSD